VKAFLSSSFCLFIYHSNERQLLPAYFPWDSDAEGVVGLYAWRRLTTSYLATLVFHHGVFFRLFQ